MVHLNFSNLAMALTFYLQTVQIWGGTPEVSIFYPSVFIQRVSYIVVDHSVLRKKILGARMYDVLHDTIPQFLFKFLKSSHPAYRDRDSWVRFFPRFVVLLFTFPNTHLVAPRFLLRSLLSYLMALICHFLHV